MVVFVNIDPRTFNVISDFAATISRTFFMLAIAQIYDVIMSRHIRNGNVIPMESLGVIPSDFFRSVQLGYSLKFSKPVICFLSLYAVAEFSHTIADVGFKVEETVTVEGEADNVLNLTKRNNAVVFESMGDPISARTLITYEFYEDRDTLSMIVRLVGSYVAAIDGIARGESPFLSAETNFSRVDELPSYAGLSPSPEETSSFAFYVSNNTEPLASIDLAIPMECQQDSMLTIEQSQGLSTDQFDNTALVPQCTYTKRRLSGIFGFNPEQASINAHFFAHVLEDVSGFDDLQDSYKIITSAGVSDVVLLTKEDRALARDRQSWKRGREVSSSILGVKVGDLFVYFGTAVLAAGKEARLPRISVKLDGGNSQVDYIRRNEYKVVANIDGDCPPELEGVTYHTPSGKIGEECMVALTLLCDPFLEDYATFQFDHEDFPVDVPEEVPCTLYRVEIIWGDNFHMDSQLVSMVAGVFGRNSPSARNLPLEIDLTQHVILAALFALGTLDKMPGVEVVISPNVNALYFIFMFLPFVAGVVLFLLRAYTKEENIIPAPREPWHLFIVGRATAGLKARPDPFPEFAPLSNYRVIDKQDDIDIVGLEGVGGYSLGAAVVSRKDGSSSGEFVSESGSGNDNDNDSDDWKDESSSGEFVSESGNGSGNDNDSDDCNDNDSDDSQSVASSSGLFVS